MSELSISTIGIRNGEFVTNRPGSKQNVGTILQVRGEYPASRSEVNGADTLLLRDGLNLVPFFARMSMDERVAWLLGHSTAKDDVYMEDTQKVKDVPGHPDLSELAIKFIKVSGEFFKKRVAPGVIDELIRGNPDDPEGYWPIGKVLVKFTDVKGQSMEGKASGKGPRGGKHTLIFRPRNWVLLPSEALPSSFTGMYFNMDDLKLTSGTIVMPLGGYLRIFKTEKMTSLIAEYAVVTAHTRKEVLTWEHLLTLCGEYAKAMETVRPLIIWFPPALYKSLIQKVIRTRCRQVEYAGQLYPAGAVLLAALCLLMLHPGSFVPNIQRHVGGMESAAKRLAVSISEDGYVEDSRYMALLYMCAAIAQQDKSWQPVDHVITWWFQAALLAQQDARIYDYDWHTFGSIKTWDNLGFSYLLLGELGSFDSDIKMMGSIAERGGKARSPVMEIQKDDLSRQVASMDVMPLIHCIDQHTYTEIGNYMPYTGKPYSEVFSDIWTRVVGMNPRLERYHSQADVVGWKADDPYVRTVRTAQRQLWTSKIHTPAPRPVEGKMITFKYDLDPSWIAGLIGPLEVKSPPAIVVLRTDDIFQMTAVKPPTRDTRASGTELTEDEKTSAIRQARAMLEQGITLRHVPNTLTQFQGVTIYLRGAPDSLQEYYLVSKENKATKWSDDVHLAYTLPIHPMGPVNVDQALLYTGDGIMEDADATFTALIRTTPEVVLQRLATYLEGSRSRILLHKIGRKGEGVDYAVLPEDSGVFHILCAICCLYPAALVKMETGFAVKLGPLMWSLRDRILLILRGTGENPIANSWAVPKPDKRKMWEHQRDILQTMQRRHTRGKRGSLLWVPVGMGKSYDATAYIHWLIEQGKMPKYCVWSLPPSAADAIRCELDMAHLPYQMLDMRLNGKIRELAPGLVNIVLHDHMRMNGLDVQLKAAAPHMLFIIDEFHKTMNPTKRTSITLEVLKLSADFVGLSGTIIKDTHTEELIQWLEQVVEFEVTIHNYWVAIGALISKKVHTNVVVDRVLIEARLLNPERYYTLVPKTLGGTASNLSFQAAVNECYGACTAEMVKQALFYIGLGEGVFICATDNKHQQQLRDTLIENGVKAIHLITKDTPITLTPADPRILQAVITTKQHVEGYTLTQFRIMIQPVLLSNQATRDQLSGRLNRIGQNSPTIRYITVHTGILSYIMKRYEIARTLSEALKGFAKDILLEDLNEINALL